MKALKLAALSTLMTCAAALAQEPPPAQQPADEYPAQAPAQTPPSTEAPAASGSQFPEFTTVDANGDGAVSKDEAKAMPVLIQVWTQADADKNDSLSTSEYDRVRQAVENPGTPQQ